MRKEMSLFDVLTAKENILTPLNGITRTDQEKRKGTS